jgi:DNA transformation protein and related proteins
LRSVDEEYVRDLFKVFGGHVSVRRMFGGAGIFADGVMFGLVSAGQIYLKTHSTTLACFEREGCRPFGYSSKNGKRVLTSYWRLPDRLYDDPEELAGWARQALAAARETQARKSRAGQRRPKKPARSTAR